MTFRGFRYVSLVFGFALVAAGLSAAPISAQQLNPRTEPLDEAKIAQFQQAVASKLGVRVDVLQAAQQAAVSLQQSGATQVQGPSTSAGGGPVVITGNNPGSGLFMITSSDPNDPVAQLIASKLNVSVQQLEQAYADAAAEVGLQLPGPGAEGTVTQFGGPDDSPVGPDTAN